MVGDIMKLKVECLGNKAGAEGFVFNNYDKGFQVIFPNGNYDGFSTYHVIPTSLNIVEADYFLEKIGHDSRVANYQFKNVQAVVKDYRRGYWKFK